MEAPSGFEPLHRSFADCSLTTWVRRLRGRHYSRFVSWNTTRSNLLFRLPEISPRIETSVLDIHGRVGYASLTIRDERDRIFSGCNPE
jgi:hypothetical protein